MDVNELMKSEDLTKNYEIQYINDNKVMGILAYIGILILVPILAARQSKFAMFHAEQAFPLCVSGAIISILLFIFGWIPVVGFVFQIIFGLLDIPILILMIIGIINAANGTCKELPFTGKLRILKLQ